MLLVLRVVVAPSSFPVRSCRMLVLSRPHSRNLVRRCGGQGVTLVPSHSHRMLAPFRNYVQGADGRYGQARLLPYPDVRRARLGMPLSMQAEVCVRNAVVDRPGSLSPRGGFLIMAVHLSCATVAANGRFWGGLTHYNGAAAFV